MKTHFRPELLPDPKRFYRDELAPRRLSRTSRGWARTTCPFHGGDNPSAFSVNLATGSFYCHACGVKGGDIVSFLMQRDGVTFKDATKALGAWRDGASTLEYHIAIQQKRQQREAELAKRSAATEQRRAVTADVRLFDRILVKAGKRLQQVKCGPEAELCWQLMADATEILHGLNSELDELIQREDAMGGIYHDPALSPVVYSEARR